MGGLERAVDGRPTGGRIWRKEGEMVVEIEGRGGDQPAWTRPRTSRALP